MLQLIQTKHFRQRIHERAISFDEVQEVLKNPDATFSTLHKSTQYVKKFPGDRTLVVYIVGTKLPPLTGKVTLKSAAWRDEVL